MTTTTADAPYTLRNIEEMLGLGRGVVAGLIAAGFVSPARGPRNEYRFTFQDVVLLRTAHHLRAARIPPRRLLRSLAKLKAQLPAELPLTGLRIRAIGNDVAVRRGDAPWETDSGQLLMDFEVAASRGSVTILPRGPATPRGAADGATPSAADGAAPSAADWFTRAERLEPTDPAAAEAAYHETLALDPGHAAAALNLGALLCETGRAAEAIALFDEALAGSPNAPLLHFNRAIALEDLGRDREAVDAYERCLALSPDLADAHYNAARLHEKLGEPKAALRHYSAYRRLHP